MRYYREGLRNTCDQWDTEGKPLVTNGILKGRGLEPPVTNGILTGRGLEPPVTNGILKGRGLQPHVTNGILKGKGLEPPVTNGILKGRGLEPPVTNEILEGKGLSTTCYLNRFFFWGRGGGGFMQLKKWEKRYCGVICIWQWIKHFQSKRQEQKY